MENYRSSGILLKFFLKARKRLWLKPEPLKEYNNWMNVFLMGDKYIYVGGRSMLLCSTNTEAIMPNFLTFSKHTVQNYKESFFKYLKYIANKIF